MWQFLTCCSTNELVSSLIGWSWSKVPGTNKVRIRSVDGLFRLVVRLKGPSTICSLHFCLRRLGWSGFRAVGQIRLVGWKQILHCLWQFFTCCSTNELVSGLISWRWSKVPSADKVSICSVNRLFCLVVRLKGPCAICRMHFRLSRLCRSGLSTILQILFCFWC